MEQDRSNIQAELDKMFPDGTEPLTIECSRALIGAILGQIIPEEAEWTYDGSGNLSYSLNGENADTGLKIAPLFRF